MDVLILGLAILIGVHLVPAVPAMRKWLVQLMGEGTYKAIFALVALTGLGLIIVGMEKAPYVPVWQPPPWGNGLAVLLLVPAFILLVAAYLPGNMHRFTPHPMLWAVVLWSVGHLFANGDAASILLFGSLGLYSLFAIWSANRLGASRATDKLRLERDIAVVAVGLLLYFSFAFLHPIFFGVPAVQGL